MGSMVEYEWLNQVLITDQLQMRNRRAADLRAECEALHSIARVLISPDLALQHLAALAARLCMADSAGICLLQQNAAGEQAIRIHKVIGKLEQVRNAVLPLDGCPCGVTVQMGSAQLFSRPGRVFPLLAELRPPVEENLSVPITSLNQVWGTIWVVNHSVDRSFDSEDRRIMESLAGFAGAVLYHQFQQLTQCNGETAEEMPEPLVNRG
jgi:GAF domain-containing protein